VSWTLFAVGAAYCLASIAGLTGIGGCAGQIVACDAAAYYYADGHAPVAITPQFGYSPVYLWAFAPFRLLSFDAFLVVWFALHVAALLWMRAGWMLAVPGLNEDVIRGNVTVFVAAALVLGLRHGSAWAFPLLTKVLPGVGMVWHLVRREWRQLMWAGGATLGIVALGLLIDAGAWREWVELLAGRGSGNTGLMVRVALAVGIVALAGMSSRAWLVPLGMIVGWSAISPPVLLLLSAIPRLSRYTAPTRSGVPSPRPTRQTRLDGRRALRFSRRFQSWIARANHPDRIPPQGARELAEPHALTER
jgi:hypothetical protein